MKAKKMKKIVNFKILDIDYLKLKEKIKNDINFSSVSHFLKVQIEKYLKD